MRPRSEIEMNQHFSGSLFMVAAPSGAGKSTLVNALLAQEPSIKLSISTKIRSWLEVQGKTKAIHHTYTYYPHIHSHRKSLQ